MKAVWIFLTIGKYLRNDVLTSCHTVILFSGDSNISQVEGLDSKCKGHNNSNDKPQRPPRTTIPHCSSVLISSPFEDEQIAGTDGWQISDLLMTVFGTQSATETVPNTATWLNSKCIACHSNDRPVKLVFDVFHSAAHSQSPWHPDRHRTPLLWNFSCVQQTGYWRGWETLERLPEHFILFRFSD